MDWITPVISGAAGVIGASVGVLGNVVNFAYQRRLSRDAYLQRTVDAKFQVYNEVLDINGREPILTPGTGSGWNATLYIDRVRPVLFRNFHLLGERVRTQVRTIDNRLQLKRWDLITEEDVAESMEYMFYFNLISLIEKEYRLYK